MNLDLFPQEGPGGAGGFDPSAPLAERMRPRSLAEVVGQDHLTARGALFERILAGATFPSLVLWGPPGSGKTTLARLLARERKAGFAGMSAVAAGVKEIRRTVDHARRHRQQGGRTVLFLDEIHRFNKAQQDALLPHVESGLLVLIGATTENPSFEVNPALLSRCRVVVLRPLGEEALGALFDRALADPERGYGGRGPSIDDGVRPALIAAADGDARRLLVTLEIAVELAVGPEGEGKPRLTLDHAREALQTKTLRHDRAGEEHFNLVSALQKSVRASDAHAAVYWTQRMLLAGEDPLYVARRLVRMAVEDVGLADPDALPRTVAAQQAVHFLGMPEGGEALVQAAVYLALAPKSNRIHTAGRAAEEVIRTTGSLPVPLALRNPVTGLMKNLGYGEGYRYDHDEPGGRSGQECLPEEIRGTRFYVPTSRGFEAALERRLRDAGGGQEDVDRGLGERDPASPEAGGEEPADDPSLA